MVLEGWEALEAGRWERARECFEAALAADGESGEVLDGLSQAAHYSGDFDRAIELKERAFAAYRKEGRDADAADVARWTGFLYGMVRGNMAAAGGWLARAESLLAQLQECPAHGYLALDAAVFEHDVAERERLATTARAIAARFGDVELEVSALALLGEARVSRGQVREGMRLLDQAMVAVSGGEVKTVGVVGDIYCRLLSACEEATDVRRAEEWLAAAERIVAWQDFVYPNCRSHYGAILMATGRWKEAERQLLTALADFGAGYRGAQPMAIVRLAELRIRQGRLEEAENLLEEADWHPAARRSLAAIALARRELDAAGELAHLCFESQDLQVPGCAPLLELTTVVQLQRGDLQAAHETLARLRDLAAASSSPRVEAAAALAAGLIGAAEGDAGAAAGLQQAVEHFAALELPLEGARARLELARVTRSVSEAGAALKVFERLGARLDADAAAALLRELGASGRAWPRRHGDLTAREEEVLGLLGEGLSNTEIADRLVISRRTAEHHVASVLSKLGLRTRAQAAAHVARHGRRPVAE